MAEVPEMQRWRAEQLEGRHGPGAARGGDIRREKLSQEIRKLKAQADLAETELAERRKRLIKVDDATREWLKVAVKVRDAFQNLASSIVPLALQRGLDHGKSAEFQNIVDEKIKGVLRLLSGSWNGKREKAIVDDGDGEGGESGRIVSSGSVAKGEVAAQ